MAACQNVNYNVYPIGLNITANEQEATGKRSRKKGAERKREEGRWRGGVRGKTEEMEKQKREE